MTEHVEEIPAYPLYWPGGWKRTKYLRQKRARYKVSFSAARDDLLSELSLLGTKRVVISSNVELRHDGYPLARTLLDGLADPGVAVYFEVELAAGRIEQVIACDKWDRVKDNLRACGMAVASLRQLERCGASEILERAFTGFKALPSGPSCWDVLGIEATDDASAIVAAYRRKSLVAHPDQGGSTEAFQTLKDAHDQAMNEVRAQLGLIPSR